jgi:hypothetical protein
MTAYSVASFEDFEGQASKVFEGLKELLGICQVTPTIPHGTV